MQGCRKTSNIPYIHMVIVTPIVRFCNCSIFCCALLCAHSSFAIMLMGKRELVALLSLSSWCLVILVWLFLLVQRVCLQFMIVVFPDHTPYSKTCVKQPLKNRQNKDLNDKW